MEALPRLHSIEEHLSSDRALIIYGPRRVGKTTLLKAFLERSSLSYKLATGGNIRVQGVLGSQDLERIREYVEGYELIAIDEAQQIENIGRNLKLMVDQFPELKIVATGSSSFELSQDIGEPLTGRKRTLTLYPLSQMEARLQYNEYELREKLPEFLIYGSYPEVSSASERKEKRFILQELVGSYLLKDVLALDRVRASQKLFDLLKMLALQLGQEVSYHELGNAVGLDVKTVARYLDLLEKGFVIHRLNGFSRNLRNEISNKSKYLFLDNGIRNAIIDRFQPLEDREDTGALFENFLAVERMKRNAHHEERSDLYFWRTHQQQEIDLIEEKEGKLLAYEVKWNPKKKVKAPSNWVKGYPDAEFHVLNPENYLGFVL